MKSFQMRLNRDNDWDRLVIEFLKSIPRYYRSQEVKRILVAHIQGRDTGTPVGATPIQPSSGRRREDSELGSRLDGLFSEGHRA